MESLYLVLLTFIIATISILVFYFRRKDYWAQRNIPHIPSIPLLGSLFVYMFRQMTVPDFHLLIYKYFPQAKYYGLMNLTMPVTVIRDPELIKEILVKSFDDFPDHQSNISAETDSNFGKNLLALQGDRWKEMRSTLSPSFTATKMKIMFELISKCSKNVVDYFIHYSEKADSLEAKDVFTRYCNDVIATTAFGISVNSMKDKNNEFYTRGKDITNVGIFRIIKIMLVVFFPQIMKRMGLTILPRQTDNFFRSVIKDTLKTREEKKIIRPDMIHLLMEARDKENGVDLSIDDIIAQAFIFFTAGFDPSSTLMSFLAHELAVNPEIQEKLRNEVDNLKDDISYETITKMKYMDMVISETLRKYPPAVLTDRVSVNSFTLPKPTKESNEYTAESKSSFWIPIYGLHHDPKYFFKPEKFDPERFNDENKEKINPYAYLPFGLGPRKCIGNRFAMMETKIIFVHILQNFILEKCEKTKDPFEFDKKLTLSIKGGFWLKFRKRASFY